MEMTNVAFSSAAALIAILLGDHLATDLRAAFAYTAVAVAGVLPQATREAQISVRDVGARGDGRTDDTAAIQAAIDTGKDVFIPPGTYLVDNIQPASNQRIFGVGPDSILKQRFGATFVISINPGSAGTPDPANNVHHVTIANITLYGLSETSGFSEHKHLMNLNGVSDVTVEGCIFKAFQGDGIYLGSSNTAGIERHNQRVTIRDNVFDGVNNMNRNGVSIIDGDTVILERNRFTRTSKVTMPGAIDIEPDSNAFAIIRNIFIRHNSGDHIGGGVGFVSLFLSLPINAYAATPSNIVVERNSVAGSPGYSFVCRDDAASLHPAVRLVIQDNKVTDSTGRGLVIDGLRGVVVRRNDILGSLHDVMIGHSGVADVAIVENRFERIGAVSRNGIIVRNGTRIRIMGNAFKNTYGAAITFGPGTTDYVSLESNRFSGLGGVRGSPVVVLPTHVTNGAHNVVRGNSLNTEFAPLEVPAKLLEQSGK